jgi:hypothetical protein
MRAPPGNAYVNTTLTEEGEGDNVVSLGIYYLCGPSHFKFLFFFAKFDRKVSFMSRVFSSSRI